MYAQQLWTRVWADRAGPSRPLRSSRGEPLRPQHNARAGPGTKINLRTSGYNHETGVFKKGSEQSVSAAHRLIDRFLITKPYYAAGALLFSLFFIYIAVSADENPTFGIKPRPECENKPARDKPLRGTPHRGPRSLSPDDSIL